MIKIRLRHRFQQGFPHGMRGDWSEYQVVDGRRVIGRFDFLADARKAYPAATRGSGIEGHLWDQMTLRLREKKRAA